jgi:hypothetical protein
MTFAKLRVFLGKTLVPVSLADFKNKKEKGPGLLFGLFQSVQVYG